MSTTSFVASRITFLSDRDEFAMDLKSFIKRQVDKKFHKWLEHKMKESMDEKYRQLSSSYLILLDTSLNKRSAESIQRLSDQHFELLKEQIKKDSQSQIQQLSQEVTIWKAFSTVSFGLALAACFKTFS